MPQVIWNESDVGVREQLWSPCLEMQGAWVPALCLQSLRAELPEQSVADMATVDQGFRVQ